MTISVRLLIPCLHPLREGAFAQQQLMVLLQCSHDTELCASYEVDQTGCGAAAGLGGSTIDLALPLICAKLASGPANTRPGTAPGQCIVLQEQGVVVGVASEAEAVALLGHQEVGNVRRCRLLSLPEARDAVSRLKVHLRQRKACV